MLTSIRAGLAIAAVIGPLIAVLYGQNGSTLVGTTHEWPSERVMTAFLLILWVLGLLMLRRTLMVVQWHGRTGSVSSGRWVWMSAIEIGLLVALFRVSNVWYLTYLNWSGQETLSALPLIFVLFPEALALPHKWAPTAGNVWLLSMFLTIGSVTAALVVAAMIRTVAATKLRLRQTKV
jgi:hypothetical protein